MSDKGYEVRSSVHINGTFPHLGVKAGHTPARSETGIGALMPWADRLWFVTYVAHKSPTGSGTGLFTVDDDMTLTKHEASVVGTYANRLIHRESNQLILGPHVIDAEGNVRTFSDLVDIRLAATARHLTDPANKVYFLGMEGEFYEADVYTLEVSYLYDLVQELEVEDNPHFKDAFTDHGRVVVANNSYYHKDFERGESAGRLAEWDGQSWCILARTQFNTVTGTNRGIGQAIFAVGQDRASALLYVYLPADGWMRYRLPRGTHTQDHAFTTEWPRIREVESERLLMDASGLFYELPAMTYDNAVWGIVPICRHLRVVGDFCSWNGLLVLAGDQTTPLGDVHPFAGQPQSNLWFGKTDDLWSFGGKPAGWGGPWWQTPVEADQPSDPFLMMGFKDKCLHVSHDGDESLNVSIELDIQGNGCWHRYAVVKTENGYGCYVFPRGLSAHWCRLRTDRGTTVTAQFIYE